MILNQHTYRDLGLLEQAAGARFIGREWGWERHFGNPFTHMNVPGTVRVGSREEAIARFRTWLDGTSDQDVQQKRRQWILDNLHTLRGRDLMCYCAPLPCHGDVLAELAVGAADPNWKGP